MRSITQDIRYSATRLDESTVELRVERESVSFVEEIIPDGQMAGMKGHRPVTNTEELVFELGMAQAHDFWEQLGFAVGERWVS